MNRLREFIGSSSGLIPAQQGLVGLVGVVSVLAGLAILADAREAEDDDRVWCGTGATWTGCSSSPISNPCFDSAPADSTEKYFYYTYGLDWQCDFYITGDSWYSSTPCSEAEQPTAEAVQTAPCFNLTSKTECSYFDDCAKRNPTEPYRYCTTYQDDDDNVYGLHCECSSTPCSEAEQPTATAVLTSTDARPAQHRLGDSYPNPFNPAVVIPLDLATDAAGVSLTVYDVLGHRVRQVWDGALGMGSHRFVWDGRDEAGKAVAAGVYIYKVEIDGWVGAKKTTKLP